MKSPKLIPAIIQPFTEREAEPDRAAQSLDGQDHQKGQSAQCAARQVY